MLEFLCEGRDVWNVTVEVPLDCEENMVVTATDSSLPDILQRPDVMSTMKKPHSVTDVR